MSHPHPMRTQRIAQPPGLCIDVLVDLDKGFPTSQVRENPHPARNGGYEKKGALRRGKTSSGHRSSLCMCRDMQYR